jgi:probable F420-dependent oxidoreductase
VKILLSVGLGQWAFGAEGPAAFWRFVDRADELGLDSIWLSDRVVTPPDARAFVLEPLVTLAGVAARTRTMKLGTSIYVLPLRNPVLAAKELATLDYLSDGRMLLAVGVGDEDDRAYEACGVPKAERGARLDEALPLMRRLWEEPSVTHEGRFYQLHDVTVDPKPPGPMPIWLGGRSEAAYRRLGRLCDGWLPSAITPDEVAHGIGRIQAYAAEAGREVEEDHFGTAVGFYVAESAAAARVVAAPYLLRRRTDHPPETFAALGPLSDCVATIERYAEAGASKFVLRPACPPEALHGAARRVGGITARLRLSRLRSAQESKRAGRWQETIPGTLRSLRLHRPSCRCRPVPGRRPCDLAAAARRRCLWTCLGRSWYCPCRSLLCMLLVASSARSVPAGSGVPKATCSATLQVGARDRRVSNGEGSVSRNQLVGIAVAVVLVVALAGYGAWSAISTRDTQIAQLRDESNSRAAELETVRQELDRRTSERDSARQDAESQRDEAAERQKLLEASMQAAEDAQGRAADLEGRLVTLQSQLADANRRLEEQTVASSTPAATTSGPDLAAIVAIDDRLLQEGTLYIGHTANAV